MLRNVFAFGLFLLFLKSHPVSACSCISNPVLTANVPTNLVSAKILRHIDAEDGPEAERYSKPLPAPLYAEIEITRSFQGEQNSNTYILKGDAGADCLPYVTAYPIGTEWVIAFSAVNDLGYAVFQGCTERLEIIDGEVEGFIRHRYCDSNDDTCIPTRDNYDLSRQELPIERLTLNEFDKLQDGYYHGLKTAADECLREHSPCYRKQPYYYTDSKTLYVPSIDVSKNYTDRKTHGSAGQVGATFTAKQDSEGLFKIIDLYLTP